MHGPESACCRIVLSNNSKGVASRHDVKGLAKVKVFIYQALLVQTRTEHILKYKKEIVRKIMFACRGQAI